MKDHLNPDEISAFVAGASNAAAEKHIGDCAACRSEAERLAGALSVYRDSVRNWSLEQESRSTERRRRKPDRRKVPLRWLGWGAAATACLIAGLALPHDFGKPAVAPQKTTAAAAISDAELLGEVSRELSEAVPPSLEPIALNQNQKRN